MNFPFKCALLTFALLGCGKGEPDANVATPAPAVTDSGIPMEAAPEFRWRNDAFRELDGDDENAERLVATVSMGPLDSMIVRLEIRTSKDGLLYRHEWPAVAYVKYNEPGSAHDSAVVLRETERQIARILNDSAFITGAVAHRFSGKTELDLDAIRYDLAEADYRALRAMKRFVPLPPGAHDDINALARAIQYSRIQTVGAETRDMPAFKYYAGGEETYVIAWSKSEGRMVRIASCC